MLSRFYLLVSNLVLYWKNFCYASPLTHKPIYALVFYAQDLSMCCPVFIFIVIQLNFEILDVLCLYLNITDIYQYFFWGKWTTSFSCNPPITLSYLSSWQLCLVRRRDQNLTAPTHPWRGTSSQQCDPCQNSSSSHQTLRTSVKQRGGLPLRMSHPSQYIGERMWRPSMYMCV